MADNANPTILNAADLPTRRRLSSHSATGKPRSFLFDDIVPADYNDPFATAATDSGLSRSFSSSSSDLNSDSDELAEPIDEQEVYDLISTISDPEHPLSLGSLAVVNLPDIHIVPAAGSSASSRMRTVLVEITPTITHCSLATVIGLGVRVRLEQALPPRFRVDVRIKEGTHSTGDQVNKQLGDKERVAAALENGTLLGVLRKMLETCQ
ncbi:hypothetical protein L228DRAFT_264471 [Xylona heveae TC161]|uniref:MIP18 family-like domain-containing protein n=1 Tax=Xylona heveae (strain CBS 132557 / TC161) TaxID=1328760 RepID=A0A165JC57_XYLHT|nr:hypothetical protein L228DRAFT_264471 [Xylona heveae TC161]KZF26039.1 hypothetical protein L228DRAFT_264471 [Xylona heveae TC161]